MRDLSTRGWRPSIFILRRRGALIDAVPDGIPLAAGAGPHSNLLLSSPALLARLMAFARGCTAIIGAMELEPTYLAYLSGRLMRKPAVGWLHISTRAYLPRLSPIHTTLARFTYPRLNQVVCCSNGVAESLAELAHVSQKKLTTIHNYVDGATVNAMANELPPDWAASIFTKPTIVGIGRLAPQKGFDVLLKAFARVRGTLDCNLLILGEGPLRQELRQFSTSLGIRQSVFMPGWFANPYPMLKQAAAFALSSRFEGHPIVLLEALLLGVPIAATDCPGGPAELLENERHGLLVPPEDDAALAEAIARLLRDPALRRSLKAAGATRVAEFTPEKIVPRWEALFADVSST